jgi:hypothetical protein
MEGIDITEKSNLERFKKIVMEIFEEMTIKIK